MYGVDPDDVITLRLRAVPSGDEILFKFRRGTKMQKIFSAYSSKRGIPESSLRFLINGERIFPHSTAEMLDLEDNDVVDVFTEISGPSNPDSSSGCSSEQDTQMKQLDAMKAVIINELEENVSASIAVSPLSTTDDTLELCADRDSMLTADLLHVAALYGVDERFAQYEFKPPGRGETADLEREAAAGPSDDEFERALSGIEPLVQAMREWDYVGSSGGSFTADRADLAELTCRERVLALQVPPTGLSALLGPIKAARPGLYKALVSHPLVTGVNSSKQRDRRTKEKEKERQRQKDKERRRERERERERGGISSKEPSASASTEDGSEENSSATSPLPVFGRDSGAEADADVNPESVEFQKKTLLSLVSKAIADGSSQAILLAVLMLYQSRESKWLSAASPSAGGASASLEVDAATDREVQELTDKAGAGASKLVGAGTLPIGAMIALLFENLRVGTSAAAPCLSADEEPRQGSDSASKPNLNPLAWNYGYAATLRAAPAGLEDSFRGRVSLGASDGGPSPSTSYTGTIATHYAHTSDGGSISCGLSDAGSMFEGSMFAEGGTETASVAESLAMLNAEEESDDSDEHSRDKSPEQSIDQDDDVRADMLRVEMQRLQEQVERVREQVENERAEQQEEEEDEDMDEDEMLAQALALSMQTVNEPPPSAAAGAEAAGAGNTRAGAPAGESAAAAKDKDGSGGDSSDTWRYSDSAPSKYKLAPANSSTAKNVRVIEQQLRGHRRRHQLASMTPVSYPEVPILSAFAPLVQRTYMQSLYSLNLCAAEDEDCRDFEELSEMSVMHAIIALLAFVSGGAEAASGACDLFPGPTLELPKERAPALQPGATTLMLLEVLLDLFVCEFRTHNASLADGEAGKLDRVGFAAMIDRLKERALDGASDEGSAPQQCDTEQFTPYVYTWVIGTLLKLLSANLASALDQRLALSSIGMHKSSAHMLLDSALEANSRGDAAVCLDRSRLMTGDADFLRPGVLPLPFLVERAIMACGGCADAATPPLIASMMAPTTTVASVYSSAVGAHLLRGLGADAFAAGYAMFFPTVKERELRLQAMLHAAPSCGGAALQDTFLWSVGDFRPSTVLNNKGVLADCFVADYYKLYAVQRCCLAACRWNLLRCHSIARSGGGRDADRDDGRGPAGDSGREVPVADRWSQLLANSAPADTLSRCSVGNADGGAGRSAVSSQSKSGSDSEKQVMLEYLRNILPSGMVAHDSALERLCGALVGDDATRKAAEKLQRADVSSARASASASVTANDPTLMTPNTSSSDLLLAAAAATNKEGDSDSTPSSSGANIAVLLPSVQQLLLSRLEHSGISTASSTVRLASNSGASELVPSSRYMYHGELSLLKLYQQRHSLHFINSCASSAMVGARAVKKMFWSSAHCDPLVLLDVDGASTVQHLGPKHWHTARVDAGFAPNSGIYEWGVRVNRCDKNHVFAGVCGADADRTTYLGGNSSSWGLIGTKALWHSRMKIRTDYGDGFGTDCTVYMRLDTNRRTLSFSSDNSDWGVAFEGLPSTVLYPAASLYQKGDSVSIFNVSAPAASPVAAGESETAAAGNEYLQDHVARLVLQAEFVSYAHEVIQAVCRITDAVDTVGASLPVSAEALAQQQQQLAHPLVTVLLPSLTATVAVSHMKREHAGHPCLQLLPFLLVISKRIAGLHEKYFNSSLGAAAVVDKSSGTGSDARLFPVTSANTASCINGGWMMKSSSNFHGGRGSSIIPSQQYYMELSCARMSSSGSGAEERELTGTDITGADCAFVVSGSGGIAVGVGGKRASRVTIHGGMVGTRIKLVETWSGGVGSCAVEGRVSLDGGYFIGQYRDCKSGSLHGNIEGVRVSGASRLIQPNLLLKVASLCTLACGKLIGALVVGLSSVNLDDALFTAPPAVEEPFAAEVEDGSEEEESKEELPQSEAGSEAEGRRMQSEEGGAFSSASPADSKPSSPDPEPAAPAVVVLHDDEVKWLRSDLLSGGLPLTAEVLEFLYQEVASRTSLASFTDLVVSGTEGPCDPALAPMAARAQPTSPVVLWWLLRAFPSLAPVIRRHNDLGETASVAPTELLPAMSACGASRSAFLSSHIVDRKPPLGASSASTVVLDDYVTHHVGQSMFLKLGGGQVFQAARRLVLAALIKHSGCVSLCRAEYDALVDGTRAQDERPTELLVEIWRATQRVIEYWVPQKAALKLTFAEIAAIVSAKARFLLELEPSVASQRLEDNLSMIPIALISVSSELRKQPSGVGAPGGSMDVSVSVRDIEQEGSRLLTDSASFLMSASTQDVAPLRAEMLKASLRGLCRSAGLRSFMMLHSSKLDDCPHFTQGAADATASPKLRLWPCTQLPALASLQLQPLAAQYIIFALHGVGDIDTWTRTHAANAAAAAAAAAAVSASASGSRSSSSTKAGAAPAPTVAQLQVKRREQQRALSACNGHYSDGLQGCSLALGDDVKLSFDVAYEHITQLLQRCIWGADKDGQCITLACWGLTIHPHDHLFLNRVGIFRTLQAVLDESRATLSKHKSGGSDVAETNIFPVCLYMNSVKRLSQLVLKVVHSLASQVACSPEKTKTDAGGKRPSGSPIAPVSPLPTGVGAEGGSFRLQRLPSGPDTLSSSLFDLLYSELFNGLKHIITLTIKAPVASAAASAAGESDATAENAVAATGIAVSPGPEVDAETAARVATLTAAANLTVLGPKRDAVSSENRSMRVSAGSGTAGPAGGVDPDQDLLGEQYIYRVLRLLHSVANSVMCQKILCSPKWLSLLIAGVGCGGLGVQRRLLKLLRRLLVLSDAKKVKAFVSSLFSERDEFICSDTALDEEDVEALVWSQENYCAESDVLLAGGEAEAQTGFDYWSLAKSASERIVVMLLEGASVVLPTSAGSHETSRNSLCCHLHASQLVGTLSAEAVSFLRVLQGSPDWREVIETVLHRYLRSVLSSAPEGKLEEEASETAAKPFEHANDELKLRMAAVSLGVYGGFIDGFCLGGLVNLRPFGLVGVSESFSLKLAAISHSCGMLVGRGANHVDVVLMEQGVTYSTVKDGATGESRTILQHSTSMPATLPVKPVRLTAGDVIHAADVAAIPEFISEPIFDDIVALLLSSCLPTIEEHIRNVKMGAPASTDADAAVVQASAEAEAASREAARRRRVGTEEDEGEDEEGEWGYEGGEHEDYDDEGHLYGEEDEDEEEEEVDILEEQEGAGLFAEQPQVDLFAPPPVAAPVDPASASRKRGDSKSSTRSRAAAEPPAPAEDDASVLSALKLLTSTFCFRTFANSMQNISLIKVFFRKHPHLLPKLLSMATATSSCGGASVVEQVEERWARLWDAYVLLNHNAANAPPAGLETAAPAVEPDSQDSGAAGLAVLGSPVPASQSINSQRPGTAGAGSGLPPPPGSGSRRQEYERSPPASQFLRRDPSSSTLPPFLQQAVAAAPPAPAPVMRQADPEMVAQMVDMGLQQSWCEFALRRCRNNIEMAINLCFEQSGEMDQLVAEEAAMAAQMQARARARAAEAASASTATTTYRRAGFSAGSSAEAGGQSLSSAARIAQLFGRVLQHRGNASSGDASESGSGDLYSTPPSAADRSPLAGSDAGALMTHLMELGFPPHWCLRALAASGNNADAALAWIASHGEELVAESEGSGRDLGMDLGGLISGLGGSGGGSAVLADIAAEPVDGDLASVRVPRGPNPLICVSGSCTIDDELNCMLPNATGGFPSVGCRGFPVCSGKWYYEALLKTAGCVQLGWVDLAYVGGADAGEGVGDDCHSWAYDGWRVYAWHERSMDWGAAWAAGDVVGCAVDLDARTISFYLNGFGEEIGMGVAYRDVHFSGGLYPCVSFNRHETVQFNFGATPFRHSPPEGYAPYIDRVRAGVQDSRVLAEDLDCFFANLTESLAAADINSGLPGDVAIVAEAKRKTARSSDDASSAADADTTATGGVDQLEDSEDLGELNSVYRYMYEDATEEYRGEGNFPAAARYFPQDEGGNSRVSGSFGANERTLRFPTAVLPAGGVPAMTTAGGTFSSVSECRAAILAQFAQLSKDLCVLYCRISLLRAVGAFALVGCPPALPQLLTLPNATTDAGADSLAEQRRQSKKAVAELLYLLRLSSLYTGRTRVFLHTMSLLPSTAAVPANLGSVCCAGGAPTLHLLKDSLRAALHHVREGSRFADSELVEQLLANVRLDTLRATRREYMNDYRLDNGYVAYCMTRNGGGAQGGSYNAQFGGAGSGTGPAPDIDCLTLPDLSLATFHTIILLEQLANEATLLESGAAGHAETAEVEAHRANIIDWVVRLVESWCTTLRSPSVTVKLCANRMLAVLLQEVSSPGSRFGEVAAQFCSDGAEGGGDGSQTSIASLLCARLCGVIPLSRLEKLAVDRLAQERPALPICSEYLQSVSELAICARNLVVMAGGSAREEAAQQYPPARLPASAEDGDDCVPSFNWEANDGRVFSDDGWAMWTGSVTQLAAEWSGSTKLPNSPNTWSEHGRTDRAPALMPGCYVVSKKAAPAPTPTSPHPIASALKSAISSLSAGAPHFVPSAAASPTAADATSAATAAAAESSTSGEISVSVGAADLASETIALNSVPSVTASPLRAEAAQRSEPTQEEVDAAADEFMRAMEMEAGEDDEDEEEEDEDDDEDHEEEEESGDEDHDEDGALEDAQQSIFEQMVAAMGSSPGSGDKDKAKAKDGQSSPKVGAGSDAFSERRRGVVVGIATWKGSSAVDAGSSASCTTDPELLRVCNGNARVIKWEGQEEPEVVRWGAEGAYDVIHVAVDKRKLAAAQTASHQSDETEVSASPTAATAPPADVLFPVSAIVKQYAEPVSAKQRAVDRLFGTEQTFGVILRLREVPFAPRPVQEVSHSADAHPDEGIVAKYDGVLEWPDFNTIVYVTARKHAGKQAELEVTERRLLTPSEGNAAWTVRFGVNKWSPTTFYLTPPNTAVAEGPACAAPPRRTADNKMLGSDYLGQFSYVARLGETLPQERVTVAGTMHLQQESLFCFDEKLKNKVFTLSHEKMMVSNNPGGGRGLVFGSVGFSVGVHYWEFKIEHADIGSIFLGVCEKPAHPGVGFSSALQQHCNKWYGAGYINHRTSFKRGINHSSTERSAVYGDHFQIGDTVGVLLDMNRGKLCFFLDGMKYGEHIIQDLGEAFDSLSSPSSVHRKTYFPVVGFQKSQDRVVITPRWLSSLGTDVHSDFQLISKASKMLATWSLQRETSQPLKSDAWVYRDSWRDWRRWISGRFMRVKSRCHASTMLLVVDTLPLSCVEASIALGLQTALFHGDRIVFTKSCGRNLDTKEEGVILGAYRKKLWYRLDNQTSGESVSEGGGLAWCLADCDVEGLVLVRRASGARSLGSVCNILLPRTPDHAGGRISICYAGGAVMRNGLEIDAAESVCTVPHDTVLYATEKRVNSSNIVRYHVVYEQHYGWISECMRGGKEDLMVTVLRSSTAEEVAAVKAEARQVLERFYDKVPSPSAPAPAEAAAEGAVAGESATAAAATGAKNPYTNVDWAEVGDMEEAMETYVASVRRHCLQEAQEGAAADADAAAIAAAAAARVDSLLGLGGVLCAGLLPQAELDYLQQASGGSSAQAQTKLTSFADAVPGYDYRDFVELASQMGDSAGGGNWSVEADMQLAELLTRCANRERVTPQNLTCVALERGVRLLDIAAAFPALRLVPTRRLLARACVLRVANLTLEYTLPYFPATLPEEKWLCNRRGTEDELALAGSGPVPAAGAATGHLYGTGGSSSCSSCPNAALYNSVDYAHTCDTAASSRLDKFPDDIGVERKLRDLSESWRPICGARKLRSLRRLVFSYTKRAFWEAICDATATATPLPQDEYEDPHQIKTIKLNRIKASVATLAALPSAHDRIKQSIFGQLHRELRNWSNASFRRAYISKGHGGQKRAFKVKFLGEGVNDYGGPYRAVFESIIDELQADSAIVGRRVSERTLLPLLVPCPNRSSGVSSNQDEYLLSPAPASPLSQELMQFLGRLVGMSVRHNITLGMTGSALLWRPLVKQALGRPHLEAVDTLISNQLAEVEKLGRELEEKVAAGAPLAPDHQPEEWRDLVFATYLSDGTRLPLVPRGEDVGVTLANWRQYVGFVERARLREGALMFKVLRDGLSTVLPTELLPIFTPVELEQLICGNSSVDVQLLRQCTEYEDSLTPDTPLVVHFWEVLEEMSPEQRTLFLRFVWARSRMPASLSELSMNFKLQLASHGGTDDMKSHPDRYLPSAQTCFFSLALPGYSSKEVLKEKLLYAIENSPNMDADVRMHSAEGWDA